MIHHPTDLRPQTDHYAVGVSTRTSGPATGNAQSNIVLAQLQAGGEQVRVALSPEDARHFALLLNAAAQSAQAGR